MLTFINTNELPRVKTPQGEITEILNRELCGAKNVIGVLRWLDPGQQFHLQDSDKHQLVYLMEGQGRLHLDKKDYNVAKGAGVYLGPYESASIESSGSAPLKIFHLEVPKIPV